MGWFTFVYSLICTAGAAGHKYNEYKDNEYNRQHLQDKDGQTYTDIYGRTRSVSSNKVLTEIHDKNGDHLLVEAKTLNVVRNYSQEERNAEYKKEVEKMRKTNGTTIKANKRDIEHLPSMVLTNDKNFRKDYKTGEIYLVRWINRRYYYINAVTGDVVRLADEDIYDPMNPEIDDIKEFNRKKRETQEDWYDKYLYKYHVSMCDYRY